MNNKYLAEDRPNFDDVFAKYYYLQLAQKNISARITSQRQNNLA
jgi:hypothetical protein